MGERDEVVPALLAGERLDRVVAMVTGLTRSEVAAVVEAGGVSVGGMPANKVSRKVREGERVEVLWDDEAFAPVAPVADPGVSYTVVYADQQVIVVDKPAGLVVHPGNGNNEGTLVHGLLARFPDMASVGGDRSRPGIVHRLDKGTSGLLVVARTDEAWTSLVEQLSERTVERRYETLVWGHVRSASGLIDAPLGRSPGDATRMAVVVGGKPARTRYEVQTRFASPVPVTELHCRLETGRTHQVRVHLRAIGHPVVGDARYGGERSTLPCPRPYLHAAELGFRHPGTGEWCRYESALPADLAEVRARLS